MLLAAGDLVMMRRQLLNLARSPSATRGGPPPDSFPSWRAAYSEAHRGGEGSPLLLVHGFTDTWRTWELVLAALEREHEVLAPTLLGHAGRPRAAARSARRR